MSWGKLNILKSSYRIQNLTHILKSNELNLGYSFCKYSSSVGNSITDDITTVKIGNVSRKIKAPSNPEFVPKNYLLSNPSQTVLRHLKWMMQKDNLGQDIFLIGPPGSFRRSLAMMYLELTKREVEYISLSRDTTESDLKQRREIVKGSAIYMNQSAVRAALHGRVLVLEGIEKAERNVLPVLNNLLENREMQLEDGRFLMAAPRFDKLLEKYSPQQLSDWKLIRCNDQFRVIALGLPVPRFRGNPLDPPLRSRFQARDTSTTSYEETLSGFQEKYGNVEPQRLMRLVSFAHAIQTDESKMLGIPDFPVDQLDLVFKILNDCPDLPDSMLLSRVYPYRSLMNKEGVELVEGLMTKFDVLDSPLDNLRVKTMTSSDDKMTATVEVAAASNQYSVPVPIGKYPLHKASDLDSKFVSTPHIESQLTDLMISHSVGDFCLMGPKGCGKSMLVSEFCRRHGYREYPVTLFTDMSSRDLLQSRYTLPGSGGDTAWRHSSLVRAALEGGLAVLDGVHRVNSGTLAVLSRLIDHRELALYDGSRLVAPARYDKIREEIGATDQEMLDKGVHRIDPRFRMVALAEPPSITSPSTASSASTAGAAGPSWLTAELLASFLYHPIPPLAIDEERTLLSRLLPQWNTEQADLLLDYVHKLRDSKDPTLQSLGSNLSTRQVIHIARHLSAYPKESIDAAIHRACLSKFLPKLVQNALHQSLEEAGLTSGPGQTGSTKEAPVCERHEGRLRIGSVSTELAPLRHEMKVPDVLFYDSVGHLMVLEEMLQDWVLGSHLLLVGNQGVGKNKIVDRFLHLLNKPREYVQLHRDTTVQALTLQPNVRDGQLVYEDSPLVRAVTLGHALVVDEADKAPTHVTSALKSLVSSGQMELADGRRILPPGGSHDNSASDVLVTHPDFRMIFLANRPGFPFLGNDFFGAMGDVFSCHAVDNPDLDSEISMLQQYGPQVPRSTIQRLAELFGELRHMADEGHIQYPYSTRELVNIVKHLQLYPEESLANVVGNVFDFDAYNVEMRKTLLEILERHGIPIVGDPNAVHLAKELPLPRLNLTGQWAIGAGGGRHSVDLPVKSRSIKVKGPVPLMRSQIDLDRSEARSHQFSELHSYWTLPMDGYNAIGDAVVSRAAPDGSKDHIHIATINPISLFTCPVGARQGVTIDLSEIFPQVSGVFRPDISLAPLGPPHHNKLLLHEGSCNILLMIDTETAEVCRLETPSFREKRPRARIFQRQPDNKPGLQMRSNWSQELPESFVAFFEIDGSTIEVFHVLEDSWHSIDLPFTIRQLHLVGKNEWIVETSNGQKHLISRPSFYDLEYTSNSITTATNDIESFDFSSNSGLSSDDLVKVLKSDASGNNRVVLDSSSYANLLVGVPDVEDNISVYTCPRPDSSKPSADTSQSFSKTSTPTPVTPTTSSVLLPSAGLLVTSLPTSRVPKAALDNQRPQSTISGYLEVVDLPNSAVRYLPVSSAGKGPPFMSWLRSGQPDVFVSRTASDDVVSIDQTGCVRVWQVARSRLVTSLDEWRRMIGEGDRNLMIERDVSSADMSLGGPKVGKIDTTGDPHVGGNQWAGGTGGRDTAGLGGVGGPYRLDAGNDVHQVPDSVKQAVPPHIKEAAREMAVKAWKDKLREINMSEHDANLYQQYAQGVSKQVSAIRIILDSLQAKSKEREWLRQQQEGDLDENKLIEGLVGEKSVYKRRGERPPEPGAPQLKPKLLRLVVDVSGSMYRFNGHDKRLEREMEAVLMLMEAFSGYESRLRYDIFGHSGEGPQFQFVHADKPPVNDKQRLDVLKAMIAHSQFCMSGDHTLEAVQAGVKGIEHQDTDDRLLILVSDANLDRYGIHPHQLGQLLTGNSSVFCCAILIGSLGEQANQLLKKLPAGHAFVCLDNKGLPEIVQQIFQATLLKSEG